MELNFRRFFEDSAIQIPAGETNADDGFEDVVDSKYTANNVKARDAARKRSKNTAEKKFGLDPIDK